MRHLKKVFVIILSFLVAGCSYDAEHQQLIHAIETENLETISRYISENRELEFYYHDGFTPLTYSATGNCFDCVKILVEAGVDVNVIQRGGVSALSWAVVNNNLKMVTYLLNAGANPNKKCEAETCLNSVEIADKYGFVDIANICSKYLQTATE